MRWDDEDYNDGHHSTVSDGRPNNVNNVKEARAEWAETVALFGIIEDPEVRWWQTWGTTREDTP